MCIEQSRPGGKPIWVIAIAAALLTTTFGCSPREWLQSKNDDAAEQPEIPPLPNRDNDLEPAASQDDDMMFVDRTAPVDPVRAMPDNRSNVPPISNGPPILDDPEPQPAAPDWSNAPSDELLAAIAKADADTKAIVDEAPPWSDQTPVENRRSLLDALRQKLAAGGALATAPDADESSVIAGRRARLQALSGLASLHDADAIGQLRYAAAKESQSPATELAIDGHTVLVALGVQSLIEGREEATGDIVDHVAAIKKLIVAARLRQQPESMTDAISILASLRGARQVLETYGEIDAAAVVSRTIVDLYGNSQNRDLAARAAIAAGEDRYQEIDALMASLDDQSSIDPQRWAEAIESLIDRSPDVQTVFYLAPLALQLESIGLSTEAETIYRILQRRFDDPNTTAGEQVAIAVEAAKRRSSMLGRLFRPEASSLSGPAINLADYAGRIVLMPFWASTSPESTNIIDPLLKIRETAPDEIAVVGMNLDLAAMPSDAGSELPSIRSFRGAAPSSDANPIAQRFGMVSLPFVVIFDRDQTVAGFGYTPGAISGLVKLLLEAPRSPN